MIHLRCWYCGDVQTVTTADEADEDPRTQGIRRAFRADHVERCGPGAVSLQLSVSATGEPIDTEAWTKYLASRPIPEDVSLDPATGMFTRSILRDGVSQAVRVCEDCWQNIPRYVDFPFGLTSPESDGGEGVVAKARPGTVETENPDRAPAIEHLARVVCLPCYLEAFGRVYPTAVPPALSAAVVGDGTPVEPPPPPDTIIVPMAARIDMVTA